MRRWLLILGIAFGIGCATHRSAHFSISGLLEQADEFYEPEPSPEELSGPTHPQVRAELRTVQMHWPLRHFRITSSFGRRWRRNHEGLDLHARKGTPVFAALSGVVAYAGNDYGGYGELIVLKHARGLATVYAHNSELRVQRGQLVKRGSRIASTGQTGRAEAPHLHFEVRDQGVALDPMLFLPAIAYRDLPSSAGSLPAAGAD